MRAAWWPKRFSKNNNAVVLMYHRIASAAIDPWKLCVTKENFEQQLAILRSKYHVVSTKALAEQLKQKSIKENTVCITFDDGYRDNYTVARLLLQQYALPATFFITSNPVIQNKNYWWDALQHIILEMEQLPASLNIQTSHFQFQFNLDGASVLTDELRKAHKDWKDPVPPPTPRAQLYYQLWQKLKPMDDAQIQQVMHAFVVACKCENLEYDSAVITTDELKDFFKNPLFAAGIHTTSHPALAYHPQKIQFEEIATCKNDLERLINKKVDVIAYPYGNYNADTINVVRQLKIDTGFSTEEKTIQHSSNPLGLGRIMVENWTGAALEEKLDTLFTNA